MLLRCPRFSRFPEGTLFLRGWMTGATAGVTPKKGWRDQVEVRVVGWVLGWCEWCLSSKRESSPIEMCLWQAGSRRPGFAIPGKVFHSP